MNPLPNDVEDLIKELESTYPPRCIEPQERLEDAHRYAGQVDLVKGLRARYDAGQQRNLPKDLI